MGVSSGVALSPMYLECQVWRDDRVSRERDMRFEGPLRCWLGCWQIISVISLKRPGMEARMSIIELTIVLRSGTRGLSVMTDFITTRQDGSSRKHASLFKIASEICQVISTPQNVHFS